MLCRAPALSSTRVVVIPRRVRLHSFDSVFTSISLTRSFSTSRGPLSHPKFSRLFDYPGKVPGMSSDSGSDTVSRIELGVKHSEWPASTQSSHDARQFLIDCAASAKARGTKTLLLPDKDADGLCASQIIHDTLLVLDHPVDLISVHFAAKGSNIHAEEEREKINKYMAQYVIAIDQGSRGGPPLADGDGVKTLVVDHHWSEKFPDNALVLSSAKHPPVATSSTLAYALCKEFFDNPGITKTSRIDMLCAVGTMGDMGTSFQWAHPWPGTDMQTCFKKYRKNTLSNVVALVNAPRRTAAYDVETAWTALMYCMPDEIVNVSQSSPPCVKRLHEARAEVKVEIDKVSRAPPKFSGDGRVALVRVNSGAQVHPVIATRWANSLKSSKLEIVMCANDGYIPGMTNFSCRVARNKRSRANKLTTGTAGPSPKRKTKLDTQHTEMEETGSDGSGEVNIIEILLEYAATDPGLREAMGQNFARGHKEASGGIVPTEQFERLWQVMLDSKPAETESASPSKKQKKDQKVMQKNTLEGWVRRS